MTYENISFETEACVAVVTLNRPNRRNALYAYAKEVMAMNAMAADAQEGISAFLGKRTASWMGR